MRGRKGVLILQDTDKEIELIRQRAKEAGAEDAILSTHHQDGGKGAVELAKAVVKACEEKRKEGNAFKVHIYMYCFQFC